MIMVHSVLWFSAYFVIALYPSKSVTMKAQFLL